MAKYMLLIYGNYEQWNAMSPEQAEAHAAAHETFQAAAGTKIIDGAELAPESVATTVRSGGAGDVTITDGPFLETKETLGGYYLLDAADLDEAIKTASMLPEVRASHSGVEIRPVVEHG